MMRDIYVLTALATIALFALKKPQVGILGWIWFSIMNPHKLTYGFIYSMPVLDGLVAATLIGCAIHWKEKAPADFHPILKILLIFYLWACLTTIFSVNFSLSSGDWINFTKTLLLVLCILLFMNKKHWIIACISVYLLSLAYTGVKGGLFTIVNAGAFRVWGPPGTTWGDNNGVALVSVMAIPLTIGFAALFSKKSYRLALYGTASMFFATVLGTQSRGGLVGLFAIGSTMVLRSQKKLLALVFVVGFGVLGFIFMPQSWHDRMQTIVNYEQDGSATSRLIQWRYAIDIAQERPFFGNGFDAFFHQPYYRRYVGDNDSNRSVHSSIFQVLGEQGFIGLLFFLSFIGMAIVCAKRYAALCIGRVDLKWAGSMIGMAQFSLIGYLANGLTLNLAYLDVMYMLVAIIVLLISHIRKELGLSVVRTPVSYGVPSHEVSR